MSSCAVPRVTCDVCWCSVSEAEVFPVYDEEAELELDTHSHTGTSETDHSPHLLHTQDSGTVVARASDEGPHNL